jgi:AcrR family transcriptional regulator
MAHKKLETQIRRDIILRAAIAAAREPGGWPKLTRRNIAKRAGCSDALVSHRLGDMKTVRRVIMRVAIKDEIVEIIAQSVAAHDGYCIPKALKQRAINSLLG